MTKAQRDELRNVVERYPVDPGSTISHKTMAELARLGYAVRQANGKWIPTAKGIEAHNRARQGT